MIETIVRALAHYNPDLGGNIATWVGAIGSMLTVAVAAFVFIKEGRQTRRAIQQTEKQVATATEQWELQRFQNASEQAARVSGWVDVCKAGSKPELVVERDHQLSADWVAATEKMKHLQGTHEGAEQTVRSFEIMERAYGPSGPSSALWAILICENKSALPVYDVVATVFEHSGDGWDELCRFQWPIWTPDTPRIESRLVGSDGQETYVRLDLGETFVSAARVEMTFTDSTGRRWMRHRLGYLSQLRS